MIDWEIRGEELANCNCNFGCPCQFGVLPTDGTCEAAVVYKIHKGHYGDVSLDGLTAAGVYKWPGAIHEGNGHMQLIIDSSATADQRKALEAIMTGADTEEMATMWSATEVLPRRSMDATSSALSWSSESRMRERRALLSASSAFPAAMAGLPTD